jgi:hypothetical protein
MKFDPRHIAGLLAGWLFVIGSPPLAAAPPPEVWVEAEGVVAFGQDTTLEAAQQGSLDAARRAAIEKAVGTFVTSSTVVHNSQLADELVHAVVRGVIVEEKILGRGVNDLTGGHGLLYQTRIRAKVRAIPTERRGNFAVTVDLNRLSFNDGDEAQLRILSSQDGYLYVFNVTQDEHITVLAPNRYVPETRLQAGTEYVFPTDALVAKGVKLRTWVVPGKKQSVEKIKVIVTRQPVSLLKGKVAEGIYPVSGGVFKEFKPTETALLTDLLRVLAMLDPADWAEATAVYEVRKR